MDAVLLFQLFVGQVLGRRLLDGCKDKMVRSTSQLTGRFVVLRRFLFQTWFGSGPAPPGLAAPVPIFDNESRRLLVVLTTKRGREVGGGVPRGVVEVIGAVVNQT